MSDQVSFIGLIVQNGFFVAAYVNEINLDSANVLQCI